MNTTRKKVLVVEDDPWFAEQHMRTLRAAGFEVLHAPDGITAIELLDREPTAAIVLDVFLPGPNALVLLHEIQSYQDLSQIPVILCSATTLEVEKDALRGYGVTDVLDKGSMNPGDLIAAIRRALA